MPPGQAIYNRFTLSIYDWYVLGLSNRFVWRCPTDRLLGHYDRHVTDNHLDIGVGTGFFLDRCRFPSNTPRVALLDINPCSLARASQRIRRFTPEILWRNVSEPFEYRGRGFDSIGMNYLLHCLPGDMASKSSVFEYAKAVLNPGGKLFGATLLSGGVQRGRVAKRLMAVYNNRSIFGNSQDDLDGLQQALAEHFPSSGVEVVGCAALFWAKAPATYPT